MVYILRVYCAMFYFFCFFFGFAGVVAFFFIFRVLFHYVDWIDGQRLAREHKEANFIRISMDRRMHCEHSCLNALFLGMAKLCFKLAVMFVATYIFRVYHIEIMLLLHSMQHIRCFCHQILLFNIIMIIFTFIGMWREFK